MNTASKYLGSKDRIVSGIEVQKLRYGKLSLWKSRKLQTGGKHSSAVLSRFAGLKTDLERGKELFHISEKYLESKNDFVFRFAL